MNLSVDKKQLAKHLAYVGGVVESKATMAVLGHVLFEAKEGKVFLSSTDLESSLYTSFPANITEGGAACMPGKKLMEVVEKMPDGDIQVDLKNEQAEFGYKKGKIKIKTLPAEDFPLIPKPEDFHFRAIKSETLEGLIKKTAYCIGADDLRKNLTGIFFDLSEVGKIRVVATDGHRLGLTENEIDNNILETFTLPRRAAVEIRKFIKDSEIVQIGVGKNHFICENGQTHILTRLVDVNFPDYKQVLPGNYKNSLRVNRKDFVDSLQRAQLVLQDKNKGAKLFLGENQIEIRTASEDGEAVEFVETSKTSENIEVGFNVKYLIDALSSFDAEEVFFSAGDEISPACIFLQEENRFKQLSVVMPMRV